MGKVTNVLKAVWNTNKKKASFWVSGFSMVAVAAIVILKWFIGIDISAANITMGVALAGAFIAFVGNVTSNKTLEEAGGSLDATKITNTANEVVDALNKITEAKAPVAKTTTTPEVKATTTDTTTPEVKATTTDTTTPEVKATTTDTTAPEVKATTTDTTTPEVTNEAPATKTTTAPEAKGNSLGIRTDADGNIVVTVVNAGPVAKSAPSAPATTNTTNFK